MPKPMVQLIGGTTLLVAMSVVAWVSVVSVVAVVAVVAMSVVAMRATSMMPW